MKKYLIRPFKRLQRPSRRRLSAMILLVILMFGIGGYLFTRPAQGATYTWDGGGADNNWSTCANWTTNTCPTSSDSVIFDSTSTKDATIDVSFQGTIVAFNINTGYTGTITSNRSLTLTGSYTQATGTFIAPSSTMNVASSITISGGTFTHNSGTINLNSSSITTQTITCTGSPFNLITMNQTHISAAVTIASGCTVPVGSNPTLQVGYNSGLTVNGTLSGSGTLSLKGYYDGVNWIDPTVTISCGSSSCLSGFSGIDTATPNTGGASSGTNFTISGAGTSLDASSYTTFTIGSKANSFVLSSSASFTAPSGTMTIGGIQGNLTINSGTTFNANGGTIVLSGTGTQTITGSVTFNNLKIINGARTVTFPASATQTVSNTLTVTGTGSGTKVALRSSSSGTQWGLDVRGTASVLYADIKDSNACQSVGHPLVAINSTNSTNNSCWTFVTSGAQNPTFILKGVTIGPGTRISGI